MRPGVATLALLATLALGACESSQTQSARLARLGAKAAVIGTVKIGAANPDVRVVHTQLLRGGGATAAVVELENTGRGAQVALPISLAAKDAKGAVVYRNTTEGLQRSLQQLATMPRGKAFWIDDQVTAATRVAAVDVKVGRAKDPSPPRSIPRIDLEGAKVETDESGTFIKGVVRNRSRVAQVEMPIYGIVRKGGRIVAAGRALLDRVPPDPTPKPIVFRILLVGADPRGGRFELVPAPTVFPSEGAEP